MISKSEHQYLRRLIWVEDEVSNGYGFETLAFASFQKSVELSQLSIVNFLEFLPPLIFLEHLQDD